MHSIFSERSHLTIKFLRIRRKPAAACTACADCEWCCSDKRGWGIRNWGTRMVRWETVGKLVRKLVDCVCEITRCGSVWESITSVNYCFNLAKCRQAASISCREQFICSTKLRSFSSYVCSWFVAYWLVWQCVFQNYVALLHATNCQSRWSAKSAHFRQCELCGTPLVEPWEVRLPSRLKLEIESWFSVPLWLIAPILVAWVACCVTTKS